MARISGIGLEEQLALKIERELSNQMDDVLFKVQKIAKQFSIQEITEKSPFKNVLVVAVETPTSLEVIKNFIRYQAGRKQSSEIWKKKSPNEPQKRFADEVVNHLNSLAENCKLILDGVESSISEELQLEEITTLQKDRLQNLQNYMLKNKPALLQSVHLRLVQLYLGYLSREHTALLK